MNEIIVALIGLLGSAIGSTFGIAVNSKLTQYRLHELEKRVDKHNNLIERTYALEERSLLQEEKLKSHARRIEKLES